MNEHTSTPSRSAYDPIAALYHRFWADWYLPGSMPALENLFFAKVPRAARVLDLCCGSGHVTRELVYRGYCVTGIDNSAALLDIARRRILDAEFRLLDARNLPFDREFDAVLSTFDSLNHILELEGLEQALAGAYRSLKPGGLFVFDMNLEQAWAVDLHEWIVDRGDNTVSLMRGLFNQNTGRAATDLIHFECAPGSDCWQRSESRVEEQCYPQSAIEDALKKAGFEEVRSILASHAGVTSDIGFGRMYFTARRCVTLETSDVNHHKGT